MKITTQINRIIIIVLILIIGINQNICQGQTGNQLYLDPRQSIEQRVKDLLSKMTLEEKIGQLNMPALFTKDLGESIEEKMEGCKEFTRGTYEEGVGPGGGFFSIPDKILHKGPRQQAEFINELQWIAREETRLGIPLFIIEEGTHGLRASGATIFPEGLAIGSTWNMDLVEEIYSTAAKEARSIGVHQLFTLVIEPNRDPRLGRNMETYSEDPYLCSRIAESIIAGAQGEGISSEDKVIAGLCHFPGQSQGTGGFERGSMEISERQLREVFLPPWEAGIKKAKKAAGKADVAIVVVGENEWRTVDNEENSVGTNGEGKDIANLDLTGLQEELIKAVHSTGTPTIVVLINGRPLSTRWTAENVPAILEA